MAPCIMKNAVQGIMARANAALATADGEKAESLRRLVATCTATLAKAKRWPEYPGGRLDTSHATEAFRAAEDVERRFPGLLGA